MIKKLKQFFSNNKKAVTIATSLFLFLFILLIFFTYVMSVNSPFINKVRSFFPMPVAVVGSSWITINEWENNVVATKHFYESQNFSEVGVRIDFKTEEGQKRLNLRRREILNKMIQDEIVKKIAKDYDIVVTNEEVKSDIKRIITEGGGTLEGAEKRAGLYGWTLDEYGENIVYVELLTNKVEKRFFEENPVSQDKVDIIKKAKNELDDGRDFADVAKKYSEGRTKDEGGALGWFEANSNQLIIEVDRVASVLELNEFSDIIESPLGLHIVKVTDSKVLSNGKKLIYVNQIFVSRKTFVDFVEEKMNETFIGIPVGNYSWDKNNFNTVFTSKEMLDFEKKIKKDLEELQKMELEK